MSLYFLPSSIPARENHENICSSKTSWTMFIGGFRVFRVDSGFVKNTVCIYDLTNFYYDQYTFSKVSTLIFEKWKIHDLDAYFWTIMTYLYKKHLKIFNFCTKVTQLPLPWQQWRIFWL